MSLIVNTVTLYTGDLKRYAQFLSNLFDIELYDNAFVFNNFTIQLKEDPRFRIDTKFTPEVSIDIDEEDFEDFKAKYEFYSFRILGMEANINIQTLNKEKYFVIYDPDMRSVKVQLKVKNSL